jgi:hypothetical protein
MVLPDSGSNPQSTSLEVSMLTIKPPMVKEIGQKE